MRAGRMSSKVFIALTSHAEGLRWHRNQLIEKSTWSILQVRKKRRADKMVTASRSDLCRKVKENISINSRYPMWLCCMIWMPWLSSDGGEEVVRFGDQ